MVGKLKSFTRAAEQLLIAQPSITQAIHKLEEELTTQLFDRSKKKITLTPEGQIFLARMEKLLLDFDQAIEELKDFSNLQKGTIKVTYNGTGKYPGHFKKSITLRTNAKTEMLRLYIEGDMTAKDAK